MSPAGLAVYLQIRLRRLWDLRQVWFYAEELASPTLRGDIPPTPPFKLNIQYEGKSRCSRSVVWNHRVTPQIYSKVMSSHWFCFPCLPLFKCCTPLSARLGRRTRRTAPLPASRVHLPPPHRLFSPRKVGHWSKHLFQLRLLHALSHVS